MKRVVAVIFCLLLTVAFTSAAPAREPGGGQSGLGTVSPGQKKPLVIIYTLSTCPHCREAKEYFADNNIPFVDREVDTDSQHMDELMRIYDMMGVPDQKRGVPLILIGDNITLQGFNREKVQDALSKIKLK